MPINLASNIAPRAGNTYFLMEDIYLKGGFRVVDNLAARDAIDASCLKAGMLVGCVDTGIIWVLGTDLLTWTQKSVKGDTGATGPQGPKGDTGTTGATGATGAQGPIGLTGPTGLTGAAGATGAQGPRGFTGADGAQGPKGDTGATGPAGADGAQGIQGLQGPKGDTGDAGAQGLQGIQGVQGDKGDKGDTGAQGPIGLTGAKGDKGDTGSIGLTGPAGATGPAGIQGPKGDQGDTGSIGLTGPAGATGPAGPQGEQGLKGDTGDQGDQGIKGDTGPQGIQGVQGDKGDKGDQGTGLVNRGNWVAGTYHAGDYVLATSSSDAAKLTFWFLRGTVDYSSTVEPHLDTSNWVETIALQGIQGGQGDKGDKGDVGATGPIGLTGAQGPAGIDGHTILSVSGAPADGTGADGDYAYDSATFMFYGPRASGVWPAGVTLRGPQGLQGLTGATGPQGEQGLQGLTGIQGPKGDLGTQIWSVTADPLATLGQDGDFAINSTAGLLWGPKASGAWPASKSLVGPQGATGAQGVQGLKGDTGITGAKGDKGDTGLQGPIGLTGPTGATGLQGPTGETGPQGATGPQGSTGPAGTPGATWYEGATAPTAATGVDGDLYLNTVSGDVSQRAAGAWTVKGNIRGPAGANYDPATTILNLPYDIAFFLAGNMDAASNIVGTFLATRKVSLPTGLAGSQAYATSLGTYAVTYDLRVNGVSKGNVTFAMGSHIGAITWTADVNLAAGDLLTVVTPSTVDNTIANVAITLVGVAAAPNGTLIP